MGMGKNTDERIRTRNEMENLSLQPTNNNGLPRDLLQRFMVSASRISELKKEKDEEDEEIELNLGLSLGGRFGVDKSNSKLVRSSSIAGYMPIVRDDDALMNTPPSSYPGVGGGGGLTRTSSLPVETEEEWRKRKELQSLRRLAAKRRRSEKQRNTNSNSNSSLIPRSERDEYVAAMGRVGSSAGHPSRFPAWVAAAAAASSRGKANSATGCGGSVESHGGRSCSSLLEPESRHILGSSSGGEASPVSIQSVQEQRNCQNIAGSSGAKPGGEIGNRSSGEAVMENHPTNRGRESALSSVEDMPSVFTKGDGPNGRKIEGILYKYGKGEEVKIMCVCHGSFLSPAEFIQHAGGTDVTHPLRHIVVNPNSSPFL